MTYPITHIVGIDREIAAVLKKAGVRSTGRLLECACSAKGRKLLADKTKFDVKQLLCWANGADRMRIRGISREYSELLQEAGVDTVRELRQRNAGKLSKAMADANCRRCCVRLLPSEAVVARWIAHAKALPLKITY